jgi:hypothetical protein
MLLETEDGSLVSLATVARFGPEVESPQGQGKARPAYDAGGNVLGYASEYEVERVQRASSPVIPAQPGWLAVVYADGASGEFWHFAEPVVAWRLDGGDPEPITASGSTGGSMDQRYFVVAPADAGATNQVFDSGGSYLGLEAALKEAEKQWREIRAAACARQERERGEAIATALPAPAGPTPADDAGG